MNKIILSSNILWTITQFRLGLIKALVKAGYQVVCVADTDDFSALSEKKIKDAGAKFIRLKINRKGINPLQDVKYTIGFYRILKREKPSVVINFTIKPIIYGSLAAAWLKIPSLAVTTGLGFAFFRNNLLTRLARLLYRFSLRYPAKVLFLNPDDLNSFVKFGIVDEKKIFCLPGEGIDTVFYQSKQSGSDEHGKRTVMVFLLVARLLWEKGIGVYVEAARKMKLRYDKLVVFQLLGYIDENNPGGIKEAKLDKWINEGIINYLGVQEDPRETIDNADCVVLPSTVREGVPRTLMEAASMQKPVVATNIPGSREVVKHNINGLLCSPNDANDLFAQMEKMFLMDNEQREKMGAAGRTLMLEQFDERIIIDHYFKFLEEIMGA